MESFLGRFIRRGQEREETSHLDAKLPDLPRALPDVEITDWEAMCRRIQHVGVNLPGVKEPEKKVEYVVDLINFDPLKISGYVRRDKYGRVSPLLSDNFGDLGPMRREKETSILKDEAERLWGMYDRTVAIRAQLASFLEEVKSRED